MTLRRSSRNRNPVPSTHKYSTINSVDNKENESTPNKTFLADSKNNEIVKPKSQASPTLRRSLRQKKSTPTSPPPETSLPKKKRKRSPPSTPTQVAQKLQDGTEVSDDHSPYISPSKRKSLEAEQPVSGENDYSEYFHCVKPTRKQISSNHSWRSLPKIEDSELNEILALSYKANQTYIKPILKHYESLFLQWRFELEQGFNLLFHGYGSKCDLLSTFSDSHLCDFITVIIYGFSPCFHFQEVLGRIGVDVLGLELKGEIHSQVAAIKDHFKQNSEKESPKLCFVIHNMDCEELQSETFQEAIAELASSPNIAIVASYDHVRTSLLWDSSKVRRLNWVYHDVCTFERYAKEINFESGLFGGQYNHGSRGAKFVLNSLPKNTKDIFKILAKEQISLSKNSKNGKGRKKASDKGLSLDRLFRMCTEKLLVRSRAMFKNQLQEFKDHKMIQLSKGADGIEMIWIDMANETLEELLEELE